MAKTAGRGGLVVGGGGWPKKFLFEKVALCNLVEKCCTKVIILKCIHMQQ